MVDTTIHCPHCQGWVTGQVGILVRCSACGGELRIHQPGGKEPGPLLSRVKIVERVGENNATSVHRPVRKRSLWIWFAVGFFIVFLGILFGFSGHYHDPSGAFVVQCPLWQYYLLEIRRAMFGSRNLGPATGATEAAMMGAFTHVVISIIGGAVMLAIAWVFRKVFGRR